MNFSHTELSKLNLGRSLKKKSIKVKRSISFVLALTYFFYGLVILVLRMYIRKYLKRGNLNLYEVFRTIAMWPKILMTILYKLGMLYNES